MTAISLLLASAATLPASVSNMSVRTEVGSGDRIAIPGLVVTEQTTFLFRAVGPGLSRFNVNGVLADPTIAVFSGSTLIRSNDDWQSNADVASLVGASDTVGAFPLDQGSRDAALLVTLAPGAYTIHVSGKNGGTGIALCESYIVPTTTTTGTLTGTVRNALSGAAIPNASIQFRNQQGVVLAESTSDATGQYSANLPQGNIIASFAAAGYVSTEMYTHVTRGSSIQADPAILAPARAGSGVVRGRIINALNGEGVPGVSLRLRSGIGSSTGSILLSAVTDASGIFTVSAVSGTYTCEASLTSFVTVYFVFAAVGAETIENQNSALTPILEPGTMRIVLSWGASPYDLDSHLTGPDGANGRFHVYYADTGASESSPYAELDLDDIYSYGPETITVTAMSEGVYRYSVHDFSNLDTLDSTELSAISNAQVRVYQGSVEVARFNVPTGRTGNLWTVFEMDGSNRQLIPINTISNAQDPMAVPQVLPSTSQSGAASFDASLEASVFINLPVKSGETH